MSRRDNLRERAISAAVWMFVQSWGGQICNLVVFVILARLLPPEAFGLVAYASVVTGLLQVVANAGLGQAVIRYERLDPAYLDTAFWTQVGIAIVIASSIVLGSDLLASLMGDAALGPILRWLSVGFVVGSLSSTQQAFMRRRLRVRPLALRTLSASLFGGLVGSTMAFSGFGVWSLVGQQLSASVMATLVLWKAAEWRPGLRISRSHLREMLGFGMAMTGSNLLRVLTDRLDRLMIGHLMGATALGFYVVGFRALRMVIELVSTPINSISLPVFARLQGNLARMRAGVDRAAALNGLIALPAATGLMVVAPNLVPLASGEQWMASVPIMQILAVFGVCQAIYAVNAPILVARGRADWMMQISVASALVTVVGIALVYRFGLVAVAGGDRRARPRRPARLPAGQRPPARAQPAFDAGTVSDLRPGLGRHGRGLPRGRGVPRIRSCRGCPGPSAARLLSSPRRPTRVSAIHDHRAHGSGALQGATRRRAKWRSRRARPRRPSR